MKLKTFLIALGVLVAIILVFAAIAGITWVGTYDSLVKKSQHYKASGSRYGAGPVLSED